MKPDDAECLPPFKTPATLNVISTEDRRMGYYHRKTVRVWPNLDNYSKSSVGVSERKEFQIIGDRGRTAFRRLTLSRCRHRLSQSCRFEAGGICQVVAPVRSSLLGSRKAVQNFYDSPRRN